MEKRGQFYLIGAAIIILVVLGLITVVNKAIVQPRPVGFFDLSEDYEAETSKVVDYGVYNKYSPSVNIAEKVRNITEIFARTEFAKDPNVHLVFIYGNSTSYVAENISSVKSEVSLSYAGTKAAADIYQQKFGIEKGSGNVNVSIAGNMYYFNLTETDNFYFVIRTTTPTGETNVAIRQ